MDPMRFLGAGAAAAPRRLLSTVVLILSCLACSPDATTSPGELRSAGDPWSEPVSGMRFRFLPPGTFVMGSPEDEPGRDDDETLHEVILTRGFWMGETEVTQGQWQTLVGTAPSFLAGCGEDCPVERVSWFEAVTYANLLSEKAGLESCYVLEGCDGTFGGGCEPDAESPGDWCPGDYLCRSVALRGLDCLGFRLPTEAEWEYAARAGAQTPIYTGGLTLRGLNDGPELDAIAWYGGNSGVGYEGGWDCSSWREKQFPAQRCGTHPVARKRANAWGLHDMIGNVWEWVWDWKGAYPAAGVTDPTGPPLGSYKVRRGCSWSNIPDHCRAADRSDDEPNLRDRNWGFRLVRTAPALTAIRPPPLGVLCEPRPPRYTLGLPR